MSFSMKMDPAILHQCFQNNLIVRYGPFRGMKYLDLAIGSVIHAKLLGSYEEPIHDWIHQVIIKGYQRVINIGCGEGYYSVGFAYMMPQTEVIAYDIYPLAREKCLELAKMNYVNKQIQIKGACTHEELNRMINYNTFIMCDIEGYEKILLDPILVPSLARADIIVKSHDCLERGITDILINRFSKTHTIEIIVDVPRDKSKYPLIGICQKQDELIFEGRPEPMPWLRLTSLHKNGS